MSLNAHPKAHDLNVKQLTGSKNSGTAAAMNADRKNRLSARQTRRAASLASLFSSEGFHLVLHGYDLDASDPGPHEVREYKGAPGEKAWTLDTDGRRHARKDSMTRLTRYQRVKAFHPAAPKLRVLPKVAIAAHRLWLEHGAKESCLHHFDKYVSASGKWGVWEQVKGSPVDGTMVRHNHSSAAMLTAAARYDKSSKKVKAALVIGAVRPDGVMVKVGLLSDIVDDFR